MNTKANSFYIGALLALLGGFLDGYSFLLRGGAFATMQTGNMIYTVLSLSQGIPGEAVKYMASIFAFACGVLVAVVIQKHWATYYQCHWQQAVLWLEILLLIVVGFLPVGQLDMVANMGISFVAAIQTESFKTMGDNNPFASTMCTGNLRSCAEQFYLAFSDENAKGRCLQYGLIICCFMSGVFLASAIIPVMGGKSVWIVAALLCVPCWVIEMKHQQP